MQAIGDIAKLFAFASFRVSGIQQGLNWCFFNGGGVHVFGGGGIHVFNFVKMMRQNLVLSLWVYRQYSKW